MYCAAAPGLTGSIWALLALRLAAESERASVQFFIFLAGDEANSLEVIR